MTKKSYKTPPIREALVEFRFNVPDTLDFDPLLPGQLHAALAGEYGGEPRRLQTMETKITQSEQGSNFSLAQGAERIQFPTADGTKTVVVSRDTLAISNVNSYEGWDQFRPRIEKVLAKYLELAKYKIVTRIGLRYINVFDVPLEEPPSKYLADVSRYSTLDSWSLFSFFDRTERRSPTGEKLLVTTVGQPTTNGTLELVLDVDAISDSKEMAEFSAVMAQVELLHSIEGVVFEKSITDSARRIFDA